MYMGFPLHAYPKQFSKGTTRVFYNLTQFWHCLPRDSISYHRSRTQSHRLPYTADATGKQCYHLILTPPCFITELRETHSALKFFILLYLCVCAVSKSVMYLSKGNMINPLKGAWFLCSSSLLSTK